MFVCAGLDAAEKKFGFSQSRETNEKITDGAREQFEKATGYVQDELEQNHVLKLTFVAKMCPTSSPTKLHVVL